MYTIASKTMFAIQQNFLEMEVRFFCALRVVQLKCHLNSISNSHSLVGNVLHTGWAQKGK